MPLRYLSLPEANYIPSYNQVDPRLVNQVDQAVAHEGRQYLQHQMTKMDALSGSMDANLQGLTPEQRQEAQQLLHQTEENLSGYVSEHGTRGAMDFLNREVRDFQQNVQPYQQRAGFMQQVAQRLEESEAPTQVKNYFHGRIQQQNRELDLAEQIQYDDYFDVIDNWIDYREFAKEMKGLTGTGRPSTVDSEGRLNPEAQFFIERAGRTGMEINNILVAEALSDPQISRQLELEARMKAESGDELYAATLDKDGKFDPTKTISVKFGDKSEEINALQAYAIQKFMPTSSLMADDSAQIKKNVLLDKAGGRDNVGFNGRRVELMPSAGPASSQDWITGLSNEMEVLNTQIDIMREDTIGFFNDVGHALDIELNEQTKQFDFTFNGRDYSATELINELKDTDPALAGQVEEIHLSQQNAKFRLDVIDSDIQRYQDNIRDTVANDPSLGKFASAIEFNKENGAYSINGERFAEILGKQPSDSDLASVIDIPQSERDRLGLNGLNPGEVIDVTFEKTPTNYAVPFGATSQAKLSHNLTVVKDDKGRFRSIGSGIRKEINEAVKSANQQFENRYIAPRQEALGYVLHPDNDKHLITEIGRIPSVQLQGSLYDHSGNVIPNIDEKEAYQIDPWKMGFQNGEPVVEVSIKDSEGRVVHSSAILKGSYATSAVQNALTPEYRALIAQNDFHRLFPNVNNGETLNINDGVKRRFGLNNLSGQDVKVTPLISYSQNNRVTSYIVNIDGNRTRFSQFSDILPYLYEQDSLKQ
jgi:hypothetical protein